MFTEDQKKIIAEMGKTGVDAERAAPLLKMTIGKFREIFDMDEEAQIAYEYAKTKAQIEVATQARLQMNDGDMNALKFVSGILGMNQDKKKVSQTDVSVKVDNQLVNPTLFLLEDEDDTEDDESTKKKKTSKSKSKNLDDEE